MAGQTGLDLNQNTGASLNRNFINTRIFSIFNFKDAIQKTLDNDLVIADMRKTSNIIGKDNQDNVFTNVLYNQFLRAYISTRLMYDRLEVIRHQYLVKIITQTLMEDAFSEDPATGNIFTVKINKDHPKSKIAQKDLDELNDTLDLDSIISPASGIMEDAIFYGEYALEIKTRSNGKIAIIDANPPGTIFGIYDNTKPQYFVRNVKKLNNTGGDYLEMVKKESIWHLTIFPRKLRFNMYEGIDYVGNAFDGSAAYPGAGTSGSNNLNNFELNEIAHYFRIGESPFLRVYDKIIELEMFEKSQVARSLGDARRSTLAGVTAPDGLELAQLDVYRKYYEGILNESGVFNTNGIVDLGQIGQMVMNLANIRVIPQQSQRGQIDLINTSHTSVNNTSTKDAILDRREIICEATGNPYEYIFGARDRNVDLRRYARYARTVKRIQSGVAESLKRLYTQLLNTGNKDLNITEKDIEVNYYNSININELDKLEYNDATVGLLSNVTRYIQELSQDPELGKFIDKKELMGFIKKSFNSMEGASDIINLKGTETVSGDDDDNGEPANGADDQEEFHEIVYKEKLQTEAVYPIQPLRKYIKNLVTNPNSTTRQNWINFVTNKYPEVPEIVLIDIKNDILRELDKVEAVT